jgi:hypothetical protein
MALSDVQSALALLFTDEAARADFLRDPQAAGRALGLDARDAETLAHLAPRAVRQFAGSLKAKSALDARKRMPLTAQALGEAFADHWRAAVAPLPAGASRADEAHALAARLATLAREKRLAPEWIGDLACYEAAFVEAAQRRFGMRARLFRFPVLRIAARLHGGDAVDECAARATLAVWARWPGGRLFHRMWMLPG